MSIWNFLKWASVQIYFVFEFLGFMKFAYHIKDRMRRTRYFIYMLMSVWKMLCFLFFMLVVMFFKGENVTQIFSLVNAGFSQHKIQVLEVIYNY